MSLNVALQAPTLESAAARLLVAARALAAARDLPGLMDVVRHAARDLTGADGVTFVLREGDLVHYADEDAISPLWKGQRFPASACISGWAMIHRQKVVIEDVYADDRIPHGAYRPTFVKSLAIVPVRPDDPVAAIGTYWARRHRATEREIELVEALAGLTSVALAHRRARRRPGRRLPAGGDPLQRQPLRRPERRRPRRHRVRRPRHGPERPVSPGTAGARGTRPRRRLDRRRGRPAPAAMVVTAQFDLLPADPFLPGF